MVQQTTVRRARGVHQWLALVVGLVFLVVGVAGFFVTGFDMDGFTETDHDQTLLVFAVNPLHNIVHVVIGLLGVMLWPSSGGARTFGWLLAIGYGATFVYGLLVLDDRMTDYLNLNEEDNWLHLGSAIVGLLIALWPRRTVVETATAAPSVYPDAAYRNPDYPDAALRDPNYRDPGTGPVP
ncbi:DUF4383 domain-containing protein [Antribacter sp. KLBMP9083]|uniref:DUF4383 domain-containing protein n=1 Tax=Antribacter soli TaxID=2910976 RepID=A0AA41UBA5_9MICO|nr:DUF4383 domain-containing protein [Antribacter soli]MCF4123557.1 DUF4383 domain-containing protein [Antribacter soli]